MRVKIFYIPVGEGEFRAIEKDINKFLADHHNRITIEDTRLVRTDMGPLLLIFYKE